MTKPILVTFATRYGSTEEVAECIAKTLREGGQSVELRPVQQVKNLSSYHAIVLGAPVFIGKWHKHAHQFLTQYGDALRQHPTAIFALGPLNNDEAELQGSRQQLDKDLEQYPWLKPAAIEMFVGKYDPARLGLGHKLLTVLPASPLYGKPASDNRDWRTIRAWASDLPVKLSSVQQPEGN